MTVEIILRFLALYMANKGESLAFVFKVRKLINKNYKQLHVLMHLAVMQNITNVNEKQHTVKIIKINVTFYTMLFEIAIFLLCTLLYAYYT